MNGSFLIGDRVEACTLMSWTVNEHEDCPLVVQPGDLGTISQVTAEALHIYWDKDAAQHIPRCINLLYFDWEDPSVRVIDE